MNFRSRACFKTNFTVFCTLSRTFPSRGLRLPNLPIRSIRCFSQRKINFPTESNRNPPTYTFIFSVQRVARPFSYLPKVYRPTCETQKSTNETIPIENHPNCWPWSSIFDNTWGNKKSLLLLLSSLVKHCCAWVRIHCCNRCRLNEKFVPVVRFEK